MIGTKYPSDVNGALAKHIPYIRSIMISFVSEVASFLAKTYKWHYWFL